MKLLEERILKDGVVLPGDILKIDSFLNHQIDSELIEEVGKEFYRLFKDVNPDKILTIESSGLVLAYATSICFGHIPIVFAKKTYSSNSGADVYLCLNIPILETSIMKFRLQNNIYLRKMQEPPSHHHNQKELHLNREPLRRCSCHIARMRAFLSGLYAYYILSCLSLS